MQHRKRPVRVLPKIYDEMSAIRPKDGVTPVISEPNEEREAMRDILGRLEAMSTQQLRQVAKNEHADVPLRYGRGMRRRFIEAIAKVRMRRWREARKGD